MIGGCYSRMLIKKSQKLCIQERSHHCDFSLGTIIGLGCTNDTFGPLPFASCDGRWQLATLNIPDQGAICHIFLMRRRSWVIWQYGLWSFQMGDTKLERFLPKNQLTQRKLLNFEFWINGKLSKVPKFDFQSQKSSESFSIFFH